MRYEDLVTPENVWVERERRLALPFRYDFGDARGVHEFGTTDEDRKGWDEVEKRADTKLKLGQPDALILIATNTGVTQIKPMEWYFIQDALGDYRQRIWEKSFAVATMPTIPTDYESDGHWE